MSDLSLKTSIKNYSLYSKGINKKNDIIIEYCFYLFFSSLALDGFLLTNNYSPISPSHIVLLLLVFYYFIGGRNTLIFEKDDFFLISLLLVAIISMIFALDSSRIFSAVLRFIYYIFIIMLSKNILKVYKICLSRALIIYSVPLLIVSIISIYNGVSYGGSGRLSYSENYNTTWYAAHLDVIVILSSYMIYKKKKILFYLLLGGGSFYFLLETQARLSILSLIVAPFLTFLFFKTINIKYSKFSKKTLLLLLVLSISIVLSILNFTKIMDYLAENYNRIYQTFMFRTVGSDAATAGRSTIWNSYLSEITKNPFNIAGWGMASTESGGSSPHNAYISLLYESSIVGLGIYISYFINLIVTNRKKPYLVFILMFMLILSLGNDMIHYKYFYIILISFFLLKYSVN